MSLVHISYHTIQIEKGVIISREINEIIVETARDGLKLISKWNSTDPNYWLYVPIESRINTKIYHINVENDDSWTKESLDGIVYWSKND